MMLGLGPYSWKQPPKGNHENINFDSFYQHNVQAFSNIIGAVDIFGVRQKYSTIEEAMFEENPEVKSLKSELTSHMTKFPVIRRIIES